VTHGVIESQKSHAALSKPTVVVTERAEAIIERDDDRVRRRREREK
jgi:hypothetical protein